MKRKNRALLLVALAACLLLGMQTTGRAALPAGVSFAFTGGTGRVAITCEGLDTAAQPPVATIVFSSVNYTYAEVDGVQYFNTNSGGNSTFEIPVQVNGITTISAETLAMGTPHVIDYDLYLYTDGTDASQAAGLTDGSAAGAGPPWLGIVLAGAAILAAVCVVVAVRRHRKKAGNQGRPAP